jgi:DNA mismatch repair ATPase MutS
MSRFPIIIKTGQAGEIPLHSDIGLDVLAEELHTCISESKLKNASLSSDHVKRKIDRWVFGFEKNPQLIAERQAIVAYALKNPDFVKVINHLVIYPNQASERDDKFTKYTGMTKRFETFAESVLALKAVLDDDARPKALDALFRGCQEMQKRIEAVNSHLNPEFELRIEIEGRYVRGLFLDIVSPQRREKCEFYYVLVNRQNNSVQRGQHKSHFGLFTYRKDYFLEGLQKSIDQKLERIIRMRPFLKRVYTINGVLTYNQSEEKAEGQLHLVREKSKEEESFPMTFKKDYDDTIRSIIEMSRFSHNYQVVSPFEEVISDFEDTIIELKALSAIIQFLNTMQDKGFPLCFPEILTVDSEKDLYLKSMYHPLLAYYSARDTVVPNDIETTASQNVRLITGANNNGKTTYITGLGLSQVLFQSGMAVVAEEAGMKLKDKILTHSVRPGDIKANQSRFAHECDRVLILIQEITSDSLILCDELFTGTAPQDGEIVSHLVLDTLIKTGATLFFITHYHGLGDAFRDSPCVAQLCCKLDHSQEPPAYTYNIKPGISGDSDGLTVASEYGVNKKNLEALLEQKARSGDFKLRSATNLKAVRQFSIE